MSELIPGPGGELFTLPQLEALERAGCGQLLWGHDDGDGEAALLGWSSDREPSPEPESRARGRYPQPSSWRLLEVRMLYAALCDDPAYGFVGRPGKPNKQAIYRAIKASLKVSEKTIKRSLELKSGS